MLTKAAFASAWEASAVFEDPWDDSNWTDVMGEDDSLSLAAAAAVLASDFILNAPHSYAEEAEGFAGGLLASELFSQPDTTMLFDFANPAPPSTWTMATTW